MKFDEKVNRDIIDFYNNRWKDFEFINFLKLQRLIHILEGISYTRIKYPRILDLGCGSGWLSGVLGLIGPTVGVDLSSDAIENAQARFPYVNFVLSDITDLNYDEEKFDIIISQEVIEHVIDQDAYIDIAHKYLKRGGYIILTTPNKKMFEAFSKEQQLQWTNQPIEHWLEIGEIKQLMLKKFKLSRITTIIPGYDPSGILRYLNSYSLRKFLAKLGLLRNYEKIFLGLGFGLHIFLIAQKSKNENS